MCADAERGYASGFERECPVGGEVYGFHPCVGVCVDRELEIVSFSEHIGFNPAYLLSATLTIILVGGYMFGITKKKKPSVCGVQAKNTFSSVFAFRPPLLTSR